MPQTKDVMMPTIRDLILELSEENPSWSNGKIADEVRRRKPNARTTAASVSSTKSRAMASGAPVGIVDALGRVRFRRQTKTLEMPLTNDLIMKLSEEHPSWSNGKIADEVRRRRPDARTTAASVSSTKSRARALGTNAGTSDRRRHGRSDSGSRLPVLHDIDPRELRSLIESGESAVLEFKSTARRNLHTGLRDQKMTTAVVKTIAAFMNSAGGTLLIGVDDGGRVVGIEEDYEFVPKSNRDGWELWLTRAVRDALGPVAATGISVRFSALDDGTIACIEVGPGPEPVYSSTKGEPRQIFFARLNNSTEELSGPYLLSYCRKRWPA